MRQEPGLLLELRGHIVIRCRTCSQANQSLQSNSRRGMMRETTSRFNVSMMTAFGVVLLGAVLLSSRKAESFQDAGKPAVKWEYNSNVVDANALQPKFAELGS